jgi:hypothetical protein
LGYLDDAVAGFDQPLASDNVSALADLAPAATDTNSEGAQTAALNIAPEPVTVTSDTTADHDVVEVPVSAASYEKADSLSMGNWVELIVDGSKTRCRLAAVIRATGKYIFVNRSGMKVAEHNRDSLAHAIDQNQVQLLDDGLLFDRALESVIGNLRDMKGRAG